MKIIHRNLKEGLMKLKTETPEDIWHLEKILEPGDIVTASTTRRTTIKRGDEIVKGERRALTLSIELEKTVMEAGQLRLRGKIVSGPEEIQLASYHSLSIEPYMILSVKKQKWQKHQLERLRKAGVKEPLLFICVLDRDEADFASMRESGLEMRGSINARKVLGKEDDRSEYYAEIAKVIEKEAPKHNAVMVAGPGFEKENLLNYMKGKSAELEKLAKSISVETANHTGRNGINEVIKTSANIVLKKTRVARETELVEKLLAEIAKEGLATYGKDEVRAAALAGAVETLLVSEEMVPENEGLMNAVEATRGNVVIITSVHEAGERFLYLGGIAAFLRYKIE